MKSNIIDFWASLHTFTLPTIHKFSKIKKQNQGDMQKTPVKSSASNVMHLHCFSNLHSWMTLPIMPFWTPNPHPKVFDMCSIQHPTGKLVPKLNFSTSPYLEPMHSFSWLPNFYSWQKLTFVMISSHQVSFKHTSYVWRISHMMSPTSGNSFSPSSLQLQGRCVT